MKKNGTIIKCHQCEKERYVTPWMQKTGRGKFCSQKCYWENKIGKRPGLVEVNCHYCGKKFKRGKHFITVVRDRGQRNFCSRKCLGLNNKKERSGKNHWNWKGGVTKRSLGHLEHREWREKVFKRDNYTCQNCGASGYLQAHHIKKWSQYPSLRYNIDNGITLCVSCHLKNGLHRK